MILKETEADLATKNYKKTFWNYTLVCNKCFRALGPGTRSLTRARLHEWTY
jgi:hypothetical protein